MFIMNNLQREKMLKTCKKTKTAKKAIKAIDTSADSVEEMTLNQVVRHADALNELATADAEVRQKVETGQRTAVIYDCGDGLAAIDAGVDEFPGVGPY